MSVNNVANNGQLNRVHGGHAMQLDADDVFVGKLRIGEIIQGKVTRHFDGSRYAVSFGDSEKIVDSSLPLTRGELVHGRVIGLSDKVQLQRVYPAQARETHVSDLATKRADKKYILENLYAQYQEKLSDSDMAKVLQLMKLHPSPILIARSSLILSKLGLPIETQLLYAVCKALSGKRCALEDDSLERVPSLNAEFEPSVRTESQTIREFAASLAMLSEPRVISTSPEQSDVDEKSVCDEAKKDSLGGNATDEGGQSGYGYHGGDRLGHWVLNAQNAGAVSHRLKRLPIWFDGKLIEVEVALFSQHEQTLQAASVRHRRIVLSLQVPGLGQVDANVYAAGQHLRIHINTETERANNSLVTQYGKIKHAIETLGWLIDEVKYSVGTQAQEGPVQSVVRHHIASDSLNRIM